MSAGGYSGVYGGSGSLEAVIQLTDMEETTPKTTHFPAGKKKLWFGFCTLVILLILLLLVLSKPFMRPEFSDFKEYEADYALTIDLLTNYYSNGNDSDHITVRLSDGQAVFEGTVLSGESHRSALATVSEKFDYAWVYEDRVIFWEDETKQYGLLWAERPGAALSDLRSWYSNVDAVRITAHWYEVGHLHTV